ncbi:MAG: tetratricopeptide repeat protein [Alphaproteobacteria bacterium]|nr:tetratricopeptide repeat protein [Alphaproteobacteria bacterium]
MSLVDAAVTGGRCAVAVSGDLLKDEQVVLALKDREALRPMALSGPPVPPTQALSDAGLARAIGQKQGVLVLVEPGDGDQPSLGRLAGMLATAPHKPTLVVVARKFNALQMMSTFRGLKVEHIKDRGQAFLAGLPVPPPEDEAAVPTVPKASERRKASEPDAPRFVFAGREEELASLVGLLGAGGPIVITGPRGIGRTQLVEHATATAGLTLLPEVSLGRGVGFDALVARLAQVCADAGQTGLADALRAEHTPTSLVAAAVDTLAAAEALAGQVLVVHNLQIAAGRTGDFFHKSRLELLVEALLTATFPLRLVFTSVVDPVFFREGQAAGLRRLALAGIKGRFFHEIFEAFHAPEFPRDRFGPISDRLHGHPLAARTFAIAARHDAGLVDDEKFFRMSGADDVEALGKQLEKRVGRLPDALRVVLARVAHLRIPLDGQLLAKLGVNRRTRTALVAEGVLDMRGTEEGAKRYAVHPLVERALGARETSDFSIFARLSDILRKEAEGAEGAARLALLQEANRCAHAARNPRDAVDVGYPDHDAALDAITALVRARMPRFDLAEKLVREVIAADPANADAHLLLLEVLRRREAPAEVQKEAVDAALAQGPVPEVYHEAVTQHLQRNARGQAITVLEQALEVLPDQARLRCRLASLLIKQGRRREAIEHLQTAMEQAPMLPDAYGLLGTLRREEGATRIDEAETMLREAVRLAPGDVVQTSRLLWLLLDIHRGVPERREAVGEEIQALLDQMLQADKTSWEAHLTYATALREMGGDSERALWFLKQARKLAPRRRNLGTRFDLEAALVDLARGRLDEAEHALRKLSRNDPTNPRIFAGIAKVLEARGQHVAAHAELLRARDRLSPHALERHAYEQDLLRLQELIQSGAASLAGFAPPPAAPAAEPAPTTDDAPEIEATEEAPVDDEELETHRREDEDDARTDDEAAEPDDGSEGDAPGSADWSAAEDEAEPRE